MQKSSSEQYLTGGSRSFVTGGRFFWLTLKVLHFYAQAEAAWPRSLQGGK